METLPQPGAFVIPQPMEAHAACARKPPQGTSELLVPEAVMHPAAHAP